MGKIKVEKPDGDAMDTSIVKEEDTYDEKLRNANAISQPMASKKLTKKIHKLIEKASKHKTYLRNGLKDVQVRLRKGETGLVIFAGDVSPVEIMCHLPGVCEERNIPYCYTPSRKDLGAAMGVKRGTVAMLIREHADYQDLYDKLKVELSGLPIPS
ncbi:H/ACA ribonucleoprotein complex subunit 2-like protein [Uranotaenia lowii]|uniref:H/ACA ribonucleoprotein complex subunit 2-like protein n=1 Tax=Uranotaenia lowii TaxID=190385 RepID=UPI00247AE31A|nr:H/ACA ribonucleoprotein complex subunit 2-like protein [Uranotaenia lowii]